MAGKVARAETRLLVNGSASHWIVLARVGLTCQRQAPGAQLPIYGRNAAIWAECIYRGRLPLSGQPLLRLCTHANTMTYTIAMGHTREPDFSQRPPLVDPAFRLEKDRARRDSVACDWYCPALDCDGATWLDVLATGAWRSATALWAQRRYMCSYRGRLPLAGQPLLRLCTMRILWRLRLL